MRRLSIAGALAISLMACEKKTEPAKASTPPPVASVQPEIKGKPVAVAVGQEGFTPSEVKIAKGEETTLVFTRTSEKTCATEVEFPELKVKKELPLNQPIAVTIPSAEARTLTFQCGMGMYKSKVLVQ